MDPATLDLSILAPLGFVAIGGMLVLIGEVWLARGRAPVTPWLVLICTASLALAMFTAGTTFLAGTSSVFNPARAMLQVDPFSSFVIVLVALSALLSIWLSMSFLPALRIDHGEYYGLIMLSVAGMFVAVSAVDLLALFVGLELVALPVCALAAFDRRKLASNEAGLKYFLVSAFATAVLLYGAALLYGATGTTSYAGIRGAFDAGDSLSLAGLALVLVGLSFKVAAVPFHQWAPDLIEGAPTSVGGFVSVAVVTAGFAALIRFLALALPESDAGVQDVLAALAIATMVVGNVMTLVQTTAKRLLAYASVAHAGTVLVAVATGTSAAATAVLFSLAAWAFTCLGAFGLLAAIARGGRERERIDDFAGLARCRPGIAALLTLFLLSLAGVPGTAGFLARFYLFQSAVESGNFVLAAVGALTSVVGLFAFLRIPAAMYMRETGEEVKGEVDTFASLALAACAVGVVWLGLLPSYGALPILGAARAAAAGLVP